MEQQDHSPRPSTFLGLAIEIRERIYDAGLCKYRRIEFKSEEISHSQHKSFVYNLVQTCQQVRKEVTAIVFRTTEWVLPHSQIEPGLRWLQQVSPLACSQFTRISVYLHVQGTINRRSDGYQADYDSCILDYSLIDEWREAAAHLFAHVNPATLSLLFFCDSQTTTDKITTAVQPFFEFPGAVRECEIRLSPEREQALLQLARQAATCVMGRQSKPFRFLDLPIEIRQNILRHTDLVTPHQQICWNSSNRFHITKLRCFCNGDLYDRPQPGLCDGWDSSKDWHREFRDHSACPLIGCFCDDNLVFSDTVCCQHGSSYAPGCRCWTPPINLLLVCRSMYREAISVLYSENRLIITPTYSEPYNRPVKVDNQGEHLEASVLTRINPDALFNLRAIEIGFQTFPHCWDPQPSDPAIRDWCAAIQHLKACANVPSLTIVLLIKTHVLTKAMVALWEESGHNPRILTSTSAFLEPLKELRHMKRLFVHFQYMSSWTGLNPSSFLHEGRSGYHPGHTDFETSMERFVMGPEYDSSALGKHQRQPSEWLRELWRKNAKPRL